MQGKKLTKLQEDKIIASKLLDDEKSLRDIGKEVGVSHVAVDKVLDKAGELITTSNTGGRSKTLLDTLDSIIANGNSVIDKFIGAIEGNPDIAIPVKTYNDLTAISGLQEKAWRQAQILKGSVTDRVDIGDYSKLTTQELEAEREKNL